MFALTTSSPSSPMCSACVRQLCRLGLEARKLGSYTSTRGKKKNAKSKTSIPVRLIQDLPGYGRKGAIVPMAMGPMRNVYFPRRVADYMTLSDTKELKSNGIVPERDFTFGKQITEDCAEIKDGQTRLVREVARSTTSLRKPIRVNLDRMQSSEAFQFLSDILPPSIVFYRTPISQSQSSVANVKEDIPQQLESVENDGVEPLESLYTSRMSAIYGSVTTGDVATAIRALVSSSEVAGRIVIGDEDVSFADVDAADYFQKEDKDRVKQLGRFNVEIKIKGHSLRIRRAVEVLREDEASVDIIKGSEAVQELAGENPVKGDESSVVLNLKVKTRDTDEKVDALIEEARELMTEGRLGAPPVELTPAKEAEIATSANGEPRTFTANKSSVEDSQRLGRSSRS